MDNIPDQMSDERAKWDALYRDLPPQVETAEMVQFNHEFVRSVQQMLPGGGATLEAGCGAGWQSLALARAGGFNVSLMDFSLEALRHARQNFAAAGLQAEFIEGDATQPGLPQYDLVFNAGVLEHYTLDQQVAMLRAMASHSRRFVLILVPNRLCYWYWLWRVEKTSQQAWSFGKEVPLTDLSGLFSRAGIGFIGHAFQAASWTESFINGLDLLSPDARQKILDIHRSGLVPQAQRGYLLAGLGSVAAGDPAALPGWEITLPALDLQSPELPAALADSLALNISLSRLLNKANTEKETGLFHQSERLAGLLNQSLADETRLAQISQLLLEKDSRLHELSQKNARLLAEKDAQLLAQKDARLLVEKDALLAERAARLDENARLLSEKEVRLSQLKVELANLQFNLQKTALALQGKDELVQEIYGSNAWKLVQLIWKGKVSLRAVRQRLVPKPAVRPGQPMPAGSSTMPAPIPIPPRQFDLASLQAITASQISDIRVVLVTHRFFDFDGNNMFFGGAERYLVELARIVRRMGYQPEILQVGNTYWERYYKNLKVTGLSCGGDIRVFHEMLRTNPVQARLLIFSPFSTCPARGEAPCIGISHGVYWDHSSFQEGSASLEVTIASLKNSLELMDRVVSVDTNTINWLRATAAPIAARCTYIPNFVDPEHFHPVPKSTDRLVVLYPRRLYGPRGFYLTLEILPELMDRYPQLEFHLVGKADPAEDEQARMLVERYPGRVRYYFLPMDRMQEAYNQADITLIPTLNSEGTSLSCLEALASGNAVIATNVGGLPDLILAGFNGLLIEPDARSLRQALVSLIEDPALRRRLGEAGRQTAEAFNLGRWQAGWQSVLAEFLPLRPPVETAPLSLVFNYAYGVFWDGVKQRPHHLAYQFAAHGIETYWLNPDGRRPDAAERLHILNRTDDLYLEHPVFFIFYPQSFEEIKNYASPLIVYDVLDDVSIHDIPGDDQAGQKARQYHQRLLQEADYVLASSRLLLEQVRKVRPDVLYVPNAVDLAHFNPDVVRPAQQLDSFTRPVVGYHGAVASWFDANLLAGAARLCPNYDFILVGPVSDPQVEAILRACANIHLLGAVSYEDLPAYVARFDVGILPFILSPLTHVVRPLKVLEYLAMRKPVVAVPLAELQDWPGVQLAGTPVEFAAAIQRALDAGPLAQNSPQVEALLRDSTWEIAARPLIAALQRRHEAS